MTARRKGRKQRPPSPEGQQFYKDLSYRLGVLRRHLGHTPQSFAAALGMTVRAYIPYERDERTQGWMRVMCGVFELTGVSVDWFLSGRPDGFDDSSPRNDRQPLFQDGRPIPPALRVVIADKNAG